MNNCNRRSYIIPPHPVPFHLEERYYHCVCPQRLRIFTWLPAGQQFSSHPGADCFQTPAPQWWRSRTSDYLRIRDGADGRCVDSIQHPLLYVRPGFCRLRCRNRIFVSLGGSFQSIGSAGVYRSLDLHCHPRHRLGLCLAQGGFGMVIISY